MQVLLIEDHKETSRSVELALAAVGIICYTATLGAEAFDLAVSYLYDVIIVDLGLPDINGFEVLVRLRQAKITTPVIILSGLSDTDSKIKSLENGADDYLTKPFEAVELVARIRSVARRSKGHAESTIQIGRVAVNIDSRTVTVDGVSLHLTSKEYAILELLALRKGSILTKEVFLNHLYGEHDEPEPKIIDVFICKLRKKLVDATGGDNYIETVWGRGYVLKDPESSGFIMNSTTEAGV